jgi:CRISPR-associated endonuclease/helicase Cas3
LATSAIGTRSLPVEWIDREPDSLARALRDALVDGGCAAVICNTVGRAQEVYRTLKAAQIVPAEKLTLFHARFPRQWREQIEGRVLDRFSKDKERPDRAIVVATQVIEQSLDLDFDLMITDLAPVDLVLQRAGRLHRHLRERRPARVSQPRLVVTKPEWVDGLPQWGSDGYVYEPYILLRSLLALQALGHSPIAIPEGVPALIEGVYGEAEPRAAEIGVALHGALQRARERMEQAMEREQFQARQNLIPRPDDEEVLSAGSRQLDEDNPELHEAWRALTRLARPSVTLVCLHRQGDTLTLDAGGGRPVDLGATVSGGLVRELAWRAVSVSDYRVVRHFLHQDPPSGWAEHAMLRYYRAAVFEEGRCHAKDWCLMLDPELGLIVEGTR